MIRRYQVRILGQATRQIPPESLIVRPVLLDDVNDVPNSVVRESHGGAGRWQCSSIVHFAGRADRVAAFGAGTIFSGAFSMATIESRPTSDWEPGYWLGWAIGWVGTELAFAGPLLGVSCGSDPHARLELKLIAAAARCANRSLGQPPRWLLRNDS